MGRRELERWARSMDAQIRAVAERTLAERPCPCCGRSRPYAEYTTGTQRHRICADCHGKRVSGEYVFCADCGLMPVQMFERSDKTKTGYRSRCNNCQPRHAVYTASEAGALASRARWAKRREDDLEFVRRIEDKQRARGETFEAVA
jgi:hypothetical protein